MNVAPPGAQTAADRATPAVRAAANRLGVNLADVTATGVGGRISAADVRAAAGVSAPAARTGSAPHAAASGATPAFTASGIPGSALAGLPGPAMAVAAAAPTAERAYAIAQATSGKSNAEAFRVLAADPNASNQALVTWAQSTNFRLGEGEAVTFVEPAGGGIPMGDHELHGEGY